jgi:hypothetical protein
MRQRRRRRRRHDKGALFFLPAASGCSCQHFRTISLYFRTISLYFRIVINAGTGISLNL